MSDTPNTPAALLAAIDRVLTVDRPAFADFARTLAALVVCRAEDPPDEDDPDALDFCDHAACGCGGPAVPVTRRLLEDLGVDVATSLVALSDDLRPITHIDTTQPPGEAVACDCDVVRYLVDVYLDGPDAIWRARQSAARIRSADVFLRWQRYLGEGRV